MHFYGFNALEYKFLLEKYSDVFTLLLDEVVVLFTDALELEVLEFELDLDGTEVLSDNLFSSHFKATFRSSIKYLVNILDFLCHLMYFFVVRRLA